MSMSCEHPDRDMSYRDTGDYDESKIARCSACGHQWFISQREWRVLTGFDEGRLPGVRRTPITKEWCENMAMLEGEHGDPEIGAGAVARDPEE